MDGVAPETSDRVFRLDSVNAGRDLAVAGWWWCSLDERWLDCERRVRWLRREDACDLPSSNLGWSKSS
jgi:hypothetical protein